MTAPVWARLRDPVLLAPLAPAAVALPLWGTVPVWFPAWVARPLLAAARAWAAAPASLPALAGAALPLSFPALSFGGRRARAAPMPSFSASS